MLSTMSDINRAFTYSERLASVKNKRESLLLSKVTRSLTKEGNQVQKSFYREKFKINSFLHKLGKNSGKLEEIAGDRYRLVVEHPGRARSALDGHLNRDVVADEISRPLTAAFCKTSPNEFRRKSDLTGLTQRRMREFLGAEHRPTQCWKSSEMVPKDIKGPETKGNDLHKEKEDDDVDDNDDDDNEHLIALMNSNMRQVNSNEAMKFVGEDAVPRIRSRISGICFCRRHSVSQNVQASPRAVSKISMENFPVSPFNGGPRVRARTFSVPLVTRFCAEEPVMRHEKQPTLAKLRRDHSSHDVVKYGNKRF